MSESEILPKFVIEMSRKRNWFSNKYSDEYSNNCSKHIKSYHSHINPKIAEKVDFEEVLSSFKKAVHYSSGHVESSAKNNQLNQNIQECKEFMYWAKRFEIDPHISDLILRSRSLTQLPWPELSLPIGSQRNYPGLFYHINKHTLSSTTTESFFNTDKLLLLPNTFRHQTAGNVINGSIQWTENNSSVRTATTDHNNRVVMKDLYLRSVPSALLGIIHKKRRLLETNVFDMSGRNSQDLLAMPGAIANMAMNHILVPVQEEMADAEDRDGKDIPFTDLLHGTADEFSYRSQALDALLARHMEGLVDSLLHTIFDKLDPIAEEIDNNRLMEEEQGEENEEDKELVPQSGLERQSSQTINKRNTPKTSKTGGIQSSNWRNVRVLSTDSGVRLAHGRGAAVSTTTTTNQKRPIFDWRSVLLVLESAMLPPQSSSGSEEGSETEHPDELPVLHLDPLVLTRVRNRLLALFVGEPIRSAPSVLRSDLKDRLPNKAVSRRKKTEVSKPKQNHKSLA